MQDLSEKEKLSVINPEAVKAALTRISPHINKTPILESHLLNKWLGAEIFFKCEVFQKMGAFKARGALNTILRLKEEGKLPAKVVAFSSGNHAQGVAWAASMVGVKAIIILPKNVSSVKKAATRSYGAEVFETETRHEAEMLAKKYADEGAYPIPPFDNDYVIEGQGTVVLEALGQEEIKNRGGPDAVFAPCGGGGLVSGSFLACQYASPNTKVYAVEPLDANDVARSYRSGEIFRFPGQPETIADGARTPGTAERTFQYIKQLAGVYEVPEEQIIYWSQWLNHLLKVTVEPTAAMAMAAAHLWLKDKKNFAKAGSQKVLVILSGGNISEESYRKIWEKDYLGIVPGFND